MGFCQESIGLTIGFALTAVTYIIGGIMYLLYVDKYYNKLLNKQNAKNEED